MKSLKKTKVFMLLAIVFFVICSVNANAALIDRGMDSLGNKLFYDDILKVTWYDFSYGVTTWNDAVSWADGLTIGYGNNTYADWRLPHALPVDGSAYNYSDANDGTTDIGYNITSPNAELAHLFYVSLGNNRDYDGFLKTGPFVKLESWYYWYGTVYGGPPQNGDFDWDT